MGYGLTDGKWKGYGVIHYRFLTRFKTNTHRAALDIWQAGLGITFQETQDSASANFKITCVGSGTAWTPSMNLLSLTDTDTLGTCLHEVGHLLGIYHEQDRPDQRATFYKLYAANLAKDMFAEGKLRSEEDGETASGFISRVSTSQEKLNLREWGDYDENSIMSYPGSKYLQKTSPSLGDFATAKAINKW